MTSALRRVLRARKRVRRAWVVTRLRLQAVVTGARLQVDVAPDVEFGRRVRFLLAPGARSTLVMGPGCQMRDDVLVILSGGAIRLGERVEIRKGTVLNVSGTFECAGRNKLSFYNVVHCSERITLELYASTNEFVSLIDSTHSHTGAHEHFYENVESSPILIGRNAWICNKASVLMGARVGRNAVVASNSVVTRDVPDATVASGAPARPVAPRAVSGPAARLAVEDTVSPEFN